MNLQRLYLWREAGYVIEREELDFDQWQALATITRWHEVQDVEATLRLVAP